MQAYYDMEYLKDISLVLITFMCNTEGKFHTLNIKSAYN